MRVAVRPELLRWAADRSMIERDELTHRFPALDRWESGALAPTFKQLEEFARTTHAPIGYFFLAEPPHEQVPIPDFRTIGSARVRRATPDLLDTIYLCQQRQEWYREFARMTGETVKPYIGSRTIKDDVVETAAEIRRTLHFEVEERRRITTWTEALRRFIELTDAAGVLVMVSGVVGSNNHRKLDPDEFRGFALCDELAPLVFINGSDTKAAQMFTLAHELAHLWLGQSAVSDVTAVREAADATERWCDEVAAELLVPVESLRPDYDPEAELRTEMLRLARRYKVSTLVILRRIHDVGGLTTPEFRRAYEEELDRILAIPTGSGGNFYLTLGARTSQRFTRALVASTLEGRSSYTEALRLLGFKKMATFEELGRNLGLVV